MSALRDSIERFAGKNAQVLGVSMDDLDTQKRFAQSLNLPFPLLADPKGEAAEAYGVKNGAYANRVTFVRVLDIPLGHKDAAFVRSHFDGMEVQINDAPRANEIMVAVAITDSGRPLPRVGGLTVQEIKGEDGLR